jgi:hypothetical protein
MVIRDRYEEEPMADNELHIWSSPVRNMTWVEAVAGHQ